MGTSHTDQSVLRLHLCPSLMGRPGQHPSPVRASVSSSAQWGQEACLPHRSCGFTSTQTRSISLAACQAPISHANSHPDCHGLMGNGKKKKKKKFLEIKKKIFLSTLQGTSLAVQWLRLCASNVGGTGLIPGRGIKIPHAVAWPKNKNK